MAKIGLTLAGGYVIFKYLTTPKINMVDQGVEEIEDILIDTFEIVKIETSTETETHRASVESVTRTSYGFEAMIELPKGFPVETFRKRLSSVEQATGSTIQMTHLKGRKVHLKLGTTVLSDRMEYHESLGRRGELSIPYFTPFGIKYIDFNDESTCHLIVAGATRMGKTVFLRLLFTHLIRATEGNVQFFYINNKLEDYYPLEGVPQIPPPAETVADAFAMLNKAKAEIARRKEILRASRDAVNVKQYNEKHPEALIPPMFIVFDEFGRFAEDDDLQDLVTEIAETAGYLDVHLIIATQRPDATSVLKPRIRANVLARVCFQTADDLNSKIVVHTDEAHNLDSIRGRAIVLDGMPMRSQIPYISEDRAMELLDPYRKVDQNAELSRQDDPVVPATLPSFVTGPVGAADLPGGGSTVGYYQPIDEAPRPRRVRNNRASPKG